jgi:cobalt-precorrin-5B (C1)-methyltransferase
MLLGHPGKLAKLAEGHRDTHSSRSPPATDYVARLCCEALGQAAPECPTVEGMFAALTEPERVRLASALAERIGSAVPKGNRTVAVCLIDMAGRRLGAWGDFSPWQ